MSCLFCQRDFDSSKNRGRTREHIFADWMEPYLRSPHGPGTQIRLQATSPEEEEPLSYPAYPAQQAVQGVCHECNSGWLSDIQVAAKRHLLPALQSTKRRAFGKDAQQAMSLWAFRAALVVGAKGGAAGIPHSYLHDFYKSRKPTDSTRIWMLATSHREFTAIDHRVVSVFRADDEPPSGTNAFVSLIAFGHVGFLVCCWTDTKPSSGLSRIYEEFGDAVLPILPVRGPVIWPPSKAFTQKGLDQLVGVLGVWEKAQEGA